MLPILSSCHLNCLQVLIFTTSYNWVKYLEYIYLLFQKYKEFDNVGCLLFNIFLSSFDDTCEYLKFVGGTQISFK